jgi:hypothetical protein
MLDPDEKDSAGMPLTCRAVYVIGPDKKLKLSILYPATTGRDFKYVSFFELFSGDYSTKSLWRNVHNDFPN